MDFRILGSLDVRTTAGIARKLNRRKPRLLLAILLLNANQRLAAGQLIDWLWGERPPASAQQNLHTYVSELRRALEDSDDSGEPRIRVRSGHYELRVEPGELDAKSFEELISRGVRAVEEKQPAVAVERFARALGLWRSDTVADGLDLPDSVRGEVARLEQLRVLAMEAAFETRIELGRHLEVLPELERATHAHPLRERLWALRMLALHRSGLRAEALAGYQELRAMLNAELGVAPGSGIRRLHDQILAADPALDAAQRPRCAVSCPLPSGSPRHGSRTGRPGGSSTSRNDCGTKGAG
jgi:DNA-binding SARP family transcriptional activator